MTIPVPDPRAGIRPPAAPTSRTRNQPITHRQLTGRRDGRERDRARVTGGTTARNTRTTRRDDHDMTESSPPLHRANQEDPEDRHLALITALIKIFATGPGDSPTEPAPRHPR